jgi:DNA replication initiation complex subunit (GINS family)
LEAAINWKESSRELITKIKEEFYKKLPAEVEDQKNDRQEVKFDAFFPYFPKKDSFKWMPQQKN